VAEIVGQFSVSEGSAQRDLVLLILFDCPLSLRQRGTDGPGRHSFYLWLAIDNWTAACDNHHLREWSAGVNLEMN
jgi:hypothetical protein